MLTQRIALVAERLGLPLPRIAGQARLGLSGTIRVTQPVPLIFTRVAEERMAEVDPGLTRAGLIDAMNTADVWTWVEVRGAEMRWRWPRPDDESDVLARCSAGDLPSQEFAIILAMSRWALRCVPARDGSGLLVLGVLPARRAPCARLLVASFRDGADASFDTTAMCTLVASQTQVRLRVDERQVEREESDDREFIMGARRYLEALREHARSSTPRAEYELIARTPVRLRRLDADAWPRAFTRPGTLIQVPRAAGPLRTLPVLDVSDDGDVLTMDGDDEHHELLDKDELQVRPGDDPIRRMREALDTIAMGTDEAHGRLLAALTRPESLPELTRPPPLQDDEQGAHRQEQAKNLALDTPDIALIHGPPGTGKTTVICEIVQELVKRGQRVLLVAPTHVALDNVLERVGDCASVTAIRLGSPDNVDERAHRFLLQHRSRDLSKRLAKELHGASGKAPPEDPVASVQRELAGRIANDADVGTLLLLNANLVCATPIGIAMAHAFRNVEVVFDVMIMDEASKATITDFLVPAARARKWILVGDHRQLAPYVDSGELEAVVTERAKRADLTEPDSDWVRELSWRLRRHFDDRMHPDGERVQFAWREFVQELTRLFQVDDVTTRELVALAAVPGTWREAQRAAVESGRDGEATKRSTVLRLGAELLELQALALPSIFERLTRLPGSRSVRLNVQHRMAPALAEFSSKLVYGGDYPSAPETKSLGLEIPGLAAPSIWIDTAYAHPTRRYEHPRDQGWSGGDYTNPLEVLVAAEVVETCATWAAQSWRGDPRERGRGANAPFEIGVTAFYLKQALQLRDAIFRRLRSGNDPWRRRWTSPAANGAAIDIHVSIVDRFQGREKDLMVLCTTRSNPDGRRGHIDNLNRMNVAVTRARHKRIVIGDSTTLAGQGSGHPRRPNDLLVRLYEGSEQKKRWGRVLGGRS